MQSPVLKAHQLPRRQVSRPGFHTPAGSAGTGCCGTTEKVPCGVGGVERRLHLPEQLNVKEEDTDAEVCV